MFLNAYGTQKNEPDSPLNALIVPYIENLGINDNYTFYKFFETCRKHNVQYDFEKKMGTVFSFMDQLSCGSFGIMIIDYDFTQIIKYSSKTLNYIGNLITFDIYPQPTSFTTLSEEKKIIIFF